MKVPNVVITNQRAQKRGCDSAPGIGLGRNGSARFGEESSMESLPQGHASREGRSRNRVPSECDSELPGFHAVDAANDTHMLQLARTIEEQIIPRLMLAHRADAEQSTRAVAKDEPITADDVRRFAKLVLSYDEDSALVSIQAMRARGVLVETIFLELLAPTARYLGDLWNEDLCSFTDVTVGLGRLQRVLREMSPAFGLSVDHAAGGRRILLLPSPGEQHTFGLVMVAEFFRRSGWDVIGGAWSADADPVAMVGAEWFDVIGFSMGAEINLQPLTETIAAVRHATCNQDIAVLVGGPMFGLHPDYAHRVGADGSTIDGSEAPALAERLISALTGQREHRA